jgi:hypothetical protein
MYDCSSYPAVVYFVMHNAPFEAAGLVNDAFEEAGDRFRTERALDREAPNVVEHQLLALRLIYLNALFFLQTAHLTGDTRPLVEQPHEDLVDTVDVFSQIVKR